MKSDVSVRPPNLQSLEKTADVVNENDKGKRKAKKVFRFFFAHAL